ncbi:MAG: diguanylate cyclase [Phycisphaerae bacterium]
MGDKPINILLIEDNPGDTRLIREFLAEKGGGQFRLEWAERLEEGLRHLDAGHVDLVLLDLSLPQSAGLDTLAVVLGHAPRVPTIVLTGLDDVAVAVEAVRQGAQDYLIKRQLDGRLLVRAVRYAVERKQIGEALEGAKQKAETARWCAESIGAVTAEVSRHMKPREIAEVVVRHLSGALHTPRCSMVLRTDDADGVEVVALYRDGKPAPFGHKGPMTLAEHPHIAEAMRERQTVVVRSQERHELALRGQAAVDKPWYYIMVPIATGEDVFGTVNIAVVDPQTTYDDQDLLMVETMCRHAAQALKNAAMVDDLEHAHAEMEKANRRLEELATTDELTGLANRRRFMEAIGLETERARRYGSDLALAMIDVDGFKAINDACGHVFGDRVLVEVARALEKGARATDVVARYGGDEIIILMPNTDAQAAVSAVERIRRRIAGRVVSDGQRSLEVTISAGISALDSKDRTAGPDLLIRQADEALYAAKHGGGNVAKTWNEIARDRTEGGADEATRVEDLRRKVAGLSLQSKEMFVQSLWGLVHALEARDAYMKAHSASVTRYAVAIAETLELDPEETGVIRRAAMVHDIGKIAVPDSILQKRGPLDDHERCIMQGHVLAGVKIIDQMHFLERETPIVRHHHEYWNGGGYPDGISGEAIPLGARILAVADAFDAITSDRVYRKARSVSEALQVLIEESGRQFDARVVDAMVKWILEIGRELGKESDLAVADLLPAPAEAAPVAP